MDTQCSNGNSHPLQNPKRQISAATKAAKAAWEKAHAEKRLQAKMARRRENRWETWALSCINGKRAAGLQVTITWPEVRSILERQGSVCALTGLPFWKAPRNKGSVSWDSPSMDRISHAGPYSSDNVRIVLHCLNTFRGRLTDDQMVRIARRMIRKLTSQPEWIERYSVWPRQRADLYAQSNTE